MSRPGCHGQAAGATQFVEGESQTLLASGDLVGRVVTPGGLNPGGVQTQGPAHRHQTVPELRELKPRVQLLKRHPRRADEHPAAVRDVWNGKQWETLK